MKILDKISFETGHGKPVVIFYSSVLKKPGSVKGGGFFKLEDVEADQNHCEILMKSDVRRVILNRKSFTIKYKTSGNLRLRLKWVDQIDQLAGFVEHTIGGGLQVKQHFARFIADLKPE